MGLLVTSQIYFRISSVEVRQELVFIPIKNEGWRAVTSVCHVNFAWIALEKLVLLILCAMFVFPLGFC
jgi:hypothetical protein